MIHITTGQEKYFEYLTRGASNSGLMALLEASDVGEVVVGEMGMELGRVVCDGYRDCTVEVYDGDDGLKKLAFVLLAQSPIDTN